ncbi:MAG TPA: nucleoside deaminase [Thermoanaerobaculia bacterium]|nr:nucleoside deaminase [Thermoanaerobaculia bacterium]HUM28635.1 nucleoside deaminase [Thermoanaerobaculia bacterium]HXK66757.1 nucleoside deaminase [Thermoanaerobaculia bacterium]
MNDSQFMKCAIDAAGKGILRGQTPFGACIVKDGNVIVSAHNRVWESRDITAHAEVVAIRKACRILDSIHLEGCSIYSTCEPCPMCFSAIHWARVDRIVFGASIEDAEMAGFNELPISNETLKDLGQGSVQIVSGCLREECRALFTSWKASGNYRAY